MHRHHAQQQLNDAKRRRALQDVLSLLRGEPDTLVPFEWIRQLAPRSERSIGLHTIELAAIVGSVERHHEFSRTFLPRVDHLDERWIAIRTLQLQGRDLPPISVYKAGTSYFVKDGNHRVSAARRGGQVFIDAHVIEIDVSVSPQPGDTLESLALRAERAHFESHVPPALLAPHATPTFTAPGRYDRLLEHIQTRHYHLGVNFNRHVTWEEAVTNWHTELYLPMTQHVRTHRLLRRFPGRSEADLYLWIMDHRYFLHEQLGQDPGDERAALDFFRHFAPSTWLSRYWRLRRRPSVPTPDPRHAR